MRMFRKGNPRALLGGMKIGAANMENTMEISQKTEKNYYMIQQNSTPGYISKENENTNSKRYTHPNVLTIIYNSQDTEAT